MIFIYMGLILLAIGLTVLYYNIVSAILIGLLLLALVIAFVMTILYVIFVGL